MQEKIYLFTNDPDQACLESKNDAYGKPNDATKTTHRKDILKAQLFCINYEWRHTPKKLHEISQEYATINSTQNPQERLSAREKVLYELVTWNPILQIVPWPSKGPHCSVSPPVRLEVEEQAKQIKAISLEVT